jgi:transcriptional regulator with XRE-family HTH domain
MALAYGLLVGMRVQKLRVDAGLSQTDLAKRIGYSQSALSLVEAGVNIATIPFLAKVAEALETSVANLVSVLDAQLAHETADRTTPAPPRCLWCAASPCRCVERPAPVAFAHATTLPTA